MWHDAGEWWCGVEEGGGRVKHRGRGNVMWVVGHAAVMGTCTGNITKVASNMNI